MSARARARKDSAIGPRPRRTSAGGGSRRAVALGLVSLPLLVGLLPGGPSLAELEPWRAATIFQLPVLALIGAVLIERIRRIPSDDREKASSFSSVAIVS